MASDGYWSEGGLGRELAHRRSVDCSAKGGQNPQCPSMEGGLATERRWRSAITASTPARVTNGCGRLGTSHSPYGHPPSNGQLVDSDASSGIGHRHEVGSKHLGHRTNRRPLFPRWVRVIVNGLSYPPDILTDGIELTSTTFAKQANRRRADLLRWAVLRVET